MIVDGRTVETVADFIFLGSKITMGLDHSHEIKRHLLLGSKAMTNLDSVLKSREPHKNTHTNKHTNTKIHKPSVDP